MFADGTSGSGTGAYIGSIIYAHSDNSMRFTTNVSERLRIFSNGSVGVGDYSSTNLGHAFQALRTSGSTYVSSKNTGGNAVFYAEASGGNTAKLELMQAGVGNYTLEVGGTNALSLRMMVQKNFASIQEVYGLMDLPCLLHLVELDYKLELILSQVVIMYIIHLVLEFKTTEV